MPNMIDALGIILKGLKSEREGLEIIGRIETVLTTLID